MLSWRELDANSLRVTAEGAMSLEDVNGVRDLVNAHIRGESVFDRTDIVELDEFPVPNSAGVYLTLPGWRIFLMLVGYQPSCRIGAIDLLTHANAVWQAGWLTHTVTKDLSTRAGAMRVAKTWTHELAPELQDEARQKDTAATALMGHAEDVRNWNPIPMNAPIEGYAWKVIEEAAQVPA